MYLRSNRKEVKDLLVPGMKFLLYVESFRKNWDTASQRHDSSRETLSRSARFPSIIPRAL
jgi:hypothetical protein